MTTALFKIIIGYGAWAIALYGIATYVLKNNVILIPGLIIGAIVALFFLKKANTDEKSQKAKVTIRDL